MCLRRRQHLHTYSFGRSRLRRLQSLADGRMLQGQRILPVHAVFSLLVLMRLEKAHSDLASRVLYARTLVLRELERLRDGFGLSVEVGVLTHMMATLMRHGSPRDRGPVGSCCELLQLEPGSLEVEWQDVEAQGGRSKWQSTIAAFTANGLPLGSGSTKYPASAAMFAAAGGRPQPDPLMDATLPASAGAIPPGPISVSVSPLGESSLIKSGGTRQGTLGVVPAAPPPPSATTSLPTPGSGPGSTAAAGATVSPPQAAQQRSFLWHKVDLLGSDLGSDAGTKGRAPAGDAAVPGPNPERHAGGGSGKGPAFGVSGVASAGVSRQTTGQGGPLASGSWAAHGGSAADGLIDSQTAWGKVEGRREAGEVAVVDLKGAEDQFTFAPWKPPPPPQAGAAAATAARGLESKSASGSGYGAKDALLPGKVPVDEVQPEVADEADPGQLRQFKTPRSLTKARTNRQLL
ncbi:hypothetical protein Vretimale_7799 [Volvox reticuliferus]|uniref:Uncharacterized protein n=1 Tax=Volvox reticuliferus TaxID=1737510 RepID=A0A8J4GA22_9CHLO|nr:hypothetical protein Vretimale_7799 [Volvox reticuliferus]